MDILSEGFMPVLVSIGCIAFFIGLIMMVSTKYKIALYIGIFLLPIAFIEPSPSDIVFIFLAAFIWRNSRFNTGEFSRIFYLAALLYLFVLINIISLFDLAELKSAIVYLAITIYVILYSLLIWSISFETKNTLVFNAYILGSTLAALLGIFGYAFHISMLTVYEFTRVKALFKDPNVFGPFLVPSIIILLSFLRFNGNNKVKLSVYLAAIIINFAGLLLSFSRGAYVNFIVALFAYIVLNCKEIGIKRVIACLVIIVLLANIAWFGVLDKDFKEFLSGRLKLQNYDSERFKAQRTGLAFAGERVFGFGPGQYVVTVEKNMGSGLAAHSLYVRLLLENGILGFTIIIIFFVALILSLLWVCMCRSGEYREKAIILLSILCGIMINSFVVDTLHWRHFWLFIGLGLGLISRRKTESLAGGSEIGIRNHQEY